MSAAYKCDRCGRLYSFNEGTPVERLKTAGYKPPKINAVKCYRFNENGNATFQGKYLDLCPSCSEKLVIFLYGYPKWREGAMKDEENEKKEEKNEDNSSVVSNSDTDQ